MQTLWDLFGRLHPVLVHFPIALVTAGAALRVFRREHPAGSVMIHLGAVGAVAATVAGFAFFDEGRFHGRAAELIELHKLLGIGTTVAAVLASLATLKWGESRVGAQLTLACLAAMLVGATGHYGGLSVFGEDHFDVGAKAPKAALANVAVAPGETVDFATHVQPIFKASCYRCHDARKRKGGLRLDKKKYFLQGGDGGQSVVAGKPIASKLFQLINLPHDHEDYMPSKGDPLTDAQVEVLRLWIAQGAKWPDGGAE